MKMEERGKISFLIGKKDKNKKRKKNKIEERKKLKFVRKINKNKK